MSTPSKIPASADACAADHPIRGKVQGLLLSNAEGFALAELCKRIAFSTVREIAVDDAEAYAMIAATDRLRACLATNGWAVR